MTDRWILVQVKSEKNISTVRNMEQFKIGQLGCGTSLAQHFRLSKFSDKQNVGAATWAHINGYMNDCICTEIFRNKKVENQND